MYKQHRSDWLLSEQESTYYSLGKDNVGVMEIINDMEKNESETDFFFSSWMSCRSCKSYYPSASNVHIVTAYQCVSVTTNVIKKRETSDSFLFLNLAVREMYQQHLFHLYLVSRKPNKLQ